MVEVPGLNGFNRAISVDRVGNDYVWGFVSGSPSYPRDVIIMLETPDGRFKQIARYVERIDFADAAITVIIKAIDNTRFIVAYSAVVSEGKAPVRKIIMDKSGNKYASSAILIPTPYTYTTPVVNTGIDYEARQSIKELNETINTLKAYIDTVEASIATRANQATSNAVDIIWSKREDLIYDRTAQIKVIAQKVLVDAINYATSTGPGSLLRDAIKKIAGI